MKKIYVTHSNNRFDLVLSEVSFPSIGQGIELGWASLSQIPIICFARTGSRVSSSLQTVQKEFFWYTDSGSLILELEKTLALYD